MSGSDGILVVRPDHLGDVLLTLPAVAALRRALPGRRITYLTSTAAEAAAAHCPSVDETATLPFPDPTAPAAAPGWSDVVERAARRLRGHFEVAVVFRPSDPWSGALVERARIPVRVGFDHPATRPSLTVAVPVVERRHVALLALDAAAAAARSLGAELRPDGGAESAHFVTTAAEEREAQERLAAVPGVGRSPIILHAGTGWRLKNWPPERWGRLAAALTDRYGVAPLVVGGPGEERLVSAVVQESGGQAAALGNVLSLGGLAALHRRARVVVASDSGPLHLAALVGAPVVGLYGPFGPDLFAPLAPAGRYGTVRVDLPCSPCGTLVAPPCGATHEPACVTGITAEAVIAAIADLMAESPATMHRATASDRREEARCAR